MNPLIFCTHSLRLSDRLLFLPHEELLLRVLLWLGLLDLLWSLGEQGWRSFDFIWPGAKIWSARLIIHYLKTSVTATQIVLFSVRILNKKKKLSLLKLILLNIQDLMFSHTYFCDHLVQTVFQFDGHIPTFYWGCKEHLQHHEHLQIWLAVKDTWTSDIK